MDDWKKVLAASITKPKDLAKYLGVDPKEVEAVVGPYPMRITPTVLATIKTKGDAIWKQVVPEAIEGSLMLASHALALVGVPMRRVLAMVRDARDARYALLRGYFHGADDNTIDEVQQERLLSVTLPAAADHVGEALGDLALHAVGVKVVSVRLAGGRVVAAEDTLTLAGGDTLVLSGLPGALALAEAKLLDAD